MITQNNDKQDSNSSVNSLKRSRNKLKVENYLRYIEYNTLINKENDKPKKTI